MYCTTTMLREYGHCNIQHLLFELRKINCLACIIDEESSGVGVMAHKSSTGHTCWSCLQRGWPVICTSFALATAQGSWSLSCRLARPPNRSCGPARPGSHEQRHGARSTRDNWKTRERLVTVLYAVRSRLRKLVII